MPVEHPLGVIDDVVGAELHVECGAIQINLFLNVGFSKGIFDGLLKLRQRVLQQLINWDKVKDELVKITAEPPNDIIKCADGTVAAIFKRDFIIG